MEKAGQAEFSQLTLMFRGITEIGTQAPKFFCPVLFLVGAFVSWAWQ